MKPSLKQAAFVVESILEPWAKEARHPTPEERADTLILFVPFLRSAQLKLVIDWARADVLAYPKEPAKITKLRRMAKRRLAELRRIQKHTRALKRQDSKR